MLFLNIGCTTKKSLNKLDKYKINNLQVGWFNETCFVTHNSTLKVGDKIQMVLLDTQQNLITATISSNLSNSKNCLPLLESRNSINQSENRYFYQIEFNKNISNKIGIGIISNSINYEQKKNLIYTDINQNKLLENYGSCTTQEGIQFYIQENNQVIWDDYYYLGYDIEPSCRQEYRI